MKKIFILIISFCITANVFAQTSPLKITHLTGDFYVFTTYKTYQGELFPANGMYVVTDKGAILIDTPWDSTQFQPLLDSIFLKHKIDVAFAIATHSHKDRTAGLEFFRKKGIKTYTSIKTDELSRKNNEKLAEFHFASEAFFTVGQHTFEAYFAGKGHTEDNIVIWFEKEKILYGGCLIKSTEATDIGYIDEGDLEEYPTTLHHLQDKFKNPSYVIPGHQSWESTNSLNHTLQLLDTHKSSYIAKFDELLQEKEPREFNGVVLVSQAGKPIYKKAIGFVDTTKKVPFQLDNQFVIMSISKQMTATLVLQEMDKKHLKLDDSIKKYLPKLTQTWADSVTIHQLLNHTSGIVSLDKPLAFKSGTKFSYSNLGYDLLGKIIEKTSGKSYAFLATELFKKCDMKNTVVPTNANQQNLIASYSEQPNGSFKEIKGIIQGLEIPAGGIISTAEDLKKWNENLHEGKLLQRTTYQKMIHYSIERNHSVLGQVGYGYGIMINDKSKIKEFGHTGWLSEQGFSTINLYYPTTKTSLIVLENRVFDEKDMDRAFYFEKQLQQISKESYLIIK